MFFPGLEMAKYISSPDSYVYPGTDVLINKANIKDAAKLAAIESFHGDSTKLARLIKDSLKTVAAKKSIHE